MRATEFIFEEFQPKAPTFADGTLRMSKHLQDRSRERDIPMASIMRALQRLEAVRGKELAELPPTGFIVKTPDNFELAIIKTQSLTTKKVEYIVATVRQQLRPGAGQRIIYLEDNLLEIARIPQGDFGDADTLIPPKNPVEKKPLPGGSKFTYAVDKTSPEDLEIMIFDGDTLAAELDLFHTRDVTGAWRVNTVAVNPEYRSQGLGKALYGIALSILKLTIEAGDTQTQHGQRMWLMLNSIPGVEVVGYNMERTPQYKPNPNDKIIAQDKDWTRYTFPVKPGTHSMRSARRGTGMYTSQASMLAKWTGK